MSEQKKETYRIILIRHGQSTANVDHTVYMRTPDHKIVLTDLGTQQSIDMGKKLKTIVKDDELDVFLSPFKRTRETWKGIKKGLGRNNLNVNMEPRIIEQKIPVFKGSNHRSESFKKQKEYSKFFFDFDGTGEAGFDVYTRVSSFIQDLKINRTLFQSKHDCIIVSHEMALRSIIMRYLKLSDHHFDAMPEIENCSPIVLETEHFDSANINHDLTIGNEKLLEFFKNLKK